MDLLLMIYQYGFYCTFLLCLYFIAVFFFSKGFIKDFLSARFGKEKGFLFIFLRNGNIVTSPLRRIKKIYFDKQGKTLQEWKSFKQKLEPLGYGFYGTKAYFKRDGDFSCIDFTPGEIDENGNPKWIEAILKVDMAKPVAVDETFIERLLEEMLIYFRRKNKILQKKAHGFPLWAVAAIVVIMSVAFGVVIFMLK